jgi:hypothetical protein
VRHRGQARLLPVLVLAPWLALTASAHHSVAFYASETIELEGELVAIAWQNPHIKLTLRTVESSGRAKLWNLESSSIFLRQQDGVTRDLFRIGDRVKVAGRPSPRDESALLATNILFPDGREAPLWPQAQPRFASADKWIRGSTREVAAVTENRGLFRVWLPPLPGSLASLPYTQAAIAARSGFDVVEFARRCEPEGMPRIMINVFPAELIDQGATIALKTELYDTVRTIHMDRAAPPPGEPRSRLGYSVGSWQDGTLVVRTTLVNWPYFDNVGTPQSEDVEITERFTLSDDQSRLEHEMTIVDAVTFTAPAVIKRQWSAYDGTIERYDCQAE